MRNRQDQQMRQILVELSLISGGSVTNYNSSGGAKGDYVDPLPRGDRRSEYLYWRNRYGPPFAPSTATSARTDADRAVVIDGAQIELDKLRGRNIDRSKVVGETNDQLEARLIKEGRGFNPDEVALQFNCTPTRVRRVRVANGHNADTGLPMVGHPDLDDKKADALRMKENGMSVRGIAMALGTHAKQVQRMLGKAA